MAKVATQTCWVTVDGESRRLTAGVTLVEDDDPVLDDHADLFIDYAGVLLPLPTTEGHVLTVHDGQWAGRPPASGGSQSDAITDPTDLENLLLWLDASQLDLEDDDPVASWPDLSGNGYNAAQATADNQPVFKAGIQNGLGGVRFVDGTPELKQLTFSGAALSMLANLNGFTVAVAMRNRDVGYGEQDILWAYSPESDENGNFRRWQVEIDTSSNYFTAFVGNDDDADFGLINAPTIGHGFGGANLLGPRAFVVAHDVITPKSTIGWTDPTYEGGSAPATYSGTPGPLPAAAALSMGIGGDEASYYGFYKLQDCDIFEIVIIGRACNARERRQLLEYLSEKWATL